MVVFFDLAYAVVIFAACALAGAVPGSLLGLLAPRPDRRLVIPALGLALAGWVWVGWLGGRYGISRLGLVLFSAVGAAGFVEGWSTGFDLGARLRRHGADGRSPRDGGRARARR